MFFIELRLSTRKLGRYSIEGSNQVDRLEEAINPEHIKELIGLINHSSYFELLDMTVCEIGYGCAKVEVNLQGKHLNLNLFISKPVVYNVCDNTGKNRALNTKRCMCLFAAFIAAVLLPSSCGFAFANPAPSSVEEYCIGNANTLRFHRPSCSGLPAEQNRITLAMRETVISEGFEPSGRCRP